MNELTRTAIASPLHDRMIFLVGARRSGTNWLQRIVGAHPEVASVPSETYLFSHGIRPLYERFHHGARRSPRVGCLYMGQDELHAALRVFCDQALHPFLEGVPGAAHLLERTPEHATALDLVGAIYPDARVVHILRDGRDVARSLLGQSWKTAPPTIEEAALEWRNAVETAERQGCSLAHYRTVRYEDMLADQFGHVTELYEWLGLRVGKDLVEAALREAGALFNVDPNAPTVAVGKWRDSLSTEQLSRFMRIAGDTLARSGYDTEPVPSSSGKRTGSAVRRRKRAGILRRKVDPSARRRSFNRRVRARVLETQPRLDDVVAALNTGDTERVSAMLKESVLVRFVEPGVDWSDRGHAGWAKLIEAIRDRTDATARQQSGDLHIAVPVSSAVMTFQAGDGSKFLRIVFVTFEDGLISHIVHYHLPLSD